MEIQWRGEGPEYHLNWSGMDWVLRLDGPTPGLERVGGDTAGAAREKLFTIAGLAARGRSSSWLAASARLVDFGMRFNRVEATYAFTDWGDLQVRGSWMIAPHVPAIDLEVQILAFSVDELKKLEVEVLSRNNWPETAPGQDASIPVTQVVYPRETLSASLSYDGRETPEVLCDLATAPVPLPGSRMLPPRIVPAAWSPVPLHYVEFAHSDDVARRVDVSPRAMGGPEPMGDTVRYCLFGHDLEKGVVLRSRMRGLWLSGGVDVRQIAALGRSFREEPLPLGP